MFGIFVSFFILFSATRRARLFAHLLRTLALCSVFVGYHIDFQCRSYEYSVPSRLLFPSVVVDDRLPLFAAVVHAHVRSTLSFTSFFRVWCCLLWPSLPFHPSFPNCMVVATRRIRLRFPRPHNQPVYLTLLSSSIQKKFHEKSLSRGQSGLLVCEDCFPLLKILKICSEIFKNLERAKSQGGRV